MAERPLARLPHARAARLRFRWEGREVEAREGDSVAASLYAAGHRLISRSRKFHRAQGLSGCFTAGHLATVDGVLHRRIDRLAAAPGLDVRAENVWPSLALDLLALARAVPRRFLRAGFEHPRWLPDDTALFRWWERALAFLAGGVSLASPRQTAPIEGRRLCVRTLVVGGGPAGRRAAREAVGPVLLVSRGERPGESAEAGGAVLEPLPPDVEVLPAHEAFGLFERGRVAGIAPHDPARPALLVDADTVVLATGVRSIAPLVPGAGLPGVLDATSALGLAHREAVPPGERVVVVGTGRRERIAERLCALGVTVVARLSVEEVHRIDGRDSVRAVVVSGGAIPCDAVVHAGPWRPDPALPFQAGAGGELRLDRGPLPPSVSIVGAAAEPAEPISVGAGLDASALVCPCMDVTVDEVLALARRGEQHVEVIKRLTGCGMGTCQGFPCWDLLAAVLAETLGKPRETFGHPTYRPPRGAITLAQAAGLADRVEAAR